MAYIRGVGRNLVVGVPMASAGERAYNGGLGAEPPTGSRGRAPGQGVRGRSTPEAESLLTFGRPTKAAEFAVLTISCEVRICDVSTKLNRLPCNPAPSPAGRLFIAHHSGRRKTAGCNWWSRRVASVTASSRLAYSVLCVISVRLTIIYPTPCSGLRNCCLCDRLQVEPSRGNCHGSDSDVDAWAGGSSGSVHWSDPDVQLVVRRAQRSESD